MQSEAQNECWQSGGRREKYMYTRRKSYARPVPALFWQIVLQPTGGSRGIQLLQPAAATFPGVYSLTIKDKHHAAEWLFTARQVRTDCVSVATYRPTIQRNNYFVPPIHAGRHRLHGTSYRRQAQLRHLSRTRTEDLSACSQSRGCM
jgi:hypothetical protein